jgi:hypothetical protein
VNAPLSYTGAVIDAAAAYAAARRHEIGLINRRKALEDDLKTLEADIKEANEATLVARAALVNAAAAEVAA